VRAVYGANMTINDIFHALLCALAVYVAFKFWEKKIHRPRVWVLDDSESDLGLFKLKIKLDDYDVRYFSKADSIINAYIKSLLTFSAPSCVVVDYYLSDQIKGDEVMTFFKRNGVDAVIVTGFEGGISNIAERDIIRKSADDSYFRSVENWIYKVTGRTV
jgi:hypothetical protein